MKYQEIYFPTIDSTNLYIKKHYKELNNFTFVSTSFQTSGKGRNDHIWLSNKDENILFSLLIKDKEIINKGSLLSLVTATSISEVLERNKFNNVYIKWPNDIYINSKKVSGILLESQLPKFIVIGIGLNVNQNEFDNEFKVEPTSLYLEKKKEININNLKKELYENLINNVLNCSDINKYISYFNNHNYLLNKEISFIYENKNRVGKVIGVDNNFNLIVNSNNENIYLNSGEVNIIVY